MPRKPVRSVIRFLVHKYISDRNHQAIFHNSLIAREGKAGHPSLYVWWRRSRRRGPRAGPGPQGRRPGQPWSRPQLPRVIAPAEFPVFRFGLPSPRGIVPNCTSRRLWPWVAGFLDPRTPDRAQVCAPADGEKVRPPTTLAQPLSPDSASSAPPRPHQAPSAARPQRGLPMPRAPGPLPPGRTGALAWGRPRLARHIGLPLARGSRATSPNALLVRPNARRSPAETPARPATARAAQGPGPRRHPPATHREGQEQPAERGARGARAPVGGHRGRFSPRRVAGAVASRRRPARERARS